MFEFLKRLFTGGGSSAPAERPSAPRREPSRAPAPAPAPVRQWQAPQQQPAPQQQYAPAQQQQQALPAWQGASRPMVANTVQPVMQMLQSLRPQEQPAEQEAEQKSPSWEDPRKKWAELPNTPRDGLIRNTDANKDDPSASDPNVWLWGPTANRTAREANEKARTGGISRDRFTGSAVDAKFNPMEDLDAYFGLNPQQKAAIQFNTGLQAAVEADKALSDYDSGGDKDYKSAVEELFGKEGGSDYYAPNTLAFVQSLGLNNDKIGDLDNFLNLSAAITQEEVDSLGAEGYKAPDQKLVEAAANKYDSEFGDEDAELLRRSQVEFFSSQTLKNISDVLEKGTSLLESIRMSSTQFNPEAASLYEGGGPTGGAALRGTDVGADLDTLINSMGSTMKEATDDDLRNVLGALNEKYQGKLDSGQVSDYMEQRLQAQEFADAAFSPEELTARYATDGYLTPAQIRARLRAL